jgi:hypothetical protein
VDRPWIRAVGPSTVYLTHKTHNVLPLAVWFTRSDDGGATWAAPVLVTQADDPAHLSGNVGKMAVSDDGRVVRIPLHRFDSAREFVLGKAAQEWLDMAESQDGGATWTVKHVAGPVATRNDGFLPTLGALNATLYAAVPLANGTQQADLTLLASHDDGATWGAPIVLARGQDMGSCQSEANVQLDAGPNGTMDAAWYHWDHGWVTSAARVQGERVLWSQDVTSPDGKAAYLEFLALAHDAQGAMRLAYPVPQQERCAFGTPADVLLLAER